MTFRPPLPLGHALTGRLGPYQLDGLIAQGGFSLVYRAFRGDQVFVIKETFDSLRVQRNPKTHCLDGLPQQSAIHQRQVQRAKEEFSRAPDLKHPNIVEIVDGFESMGTYYLVMPFLKGHDLADLVGRKVYSMHEALVVILPVLEALQFLHSKNVVHRDVKPDNIWIREADGRPLLLDTGMAREFGESVRVGTSIVTPFGAPEIRGAFEFKKFGGVGPGTDVFAVAGLLATMLTGQEPPGVADRMLPDGGKTDRLNQWTVDGRPALSQALRKALALQRMDRHAAVGDFRSEIVVAAQQVKSSKVVGGTSEIRNSMQTNRTERTESQYLLAWLLVVLAMCIAMAIVALVFLDSEPGIAALIFLVLHCGFAFARQRRLSSKGLSSMRTDPWVWMPILNMFK